jgi:hypothetical protein
MRNRFGIGGKGELLRLCVSGLLRDENEGD